MKTILLEVQLWARRYWAKTLSAARKFEEFLNWGKSRPKNLVQQITTDRPLTRKSYSCQNTSCLPENEKRSRQDNCFVPSRQHCVVAYCSYYSYSQWFLGSRSLLVVFYFYPNSERSPMERRAPAQSLSPDQCTWGPSSGTTQTQLYSSSTNTFITCSLYTVRGYCTSPGAPDLWARLGWLQGSTWNGM